MNKKKSALGLISTDGHFQEISSLTVDSLFYVSKSKNELEQLLEEKVAVEEYEECAIIRDELIKRNKR
ncbi:hypothetical protein [Pedobacter sp. SYSU D00535]|uniref:hypothetical protein n=1 Tax=Pedobacter sp. SYSU D00535 TaxID=2810308 RepID=UPI001A95D317|nr:hypothetical protein [Pedobacter sp. SYSU D00535]